MDRAGWERSAWQKFSTARAGASQPPPTRRTQYKHAAHQLLWSVDGINPIRPCHSDRCIVIELTALAVNKRENLGDQIK